MTIHQTFELSQQLGIPRIKDLDLAERLEFAEARMIRKLIERNTEELESYDVICSMASQNADPKGRGRPGKEYWLTEGQALVICALSRTPRAAAVRKLVIEVFMEWRREQERKTVLAAPLPALVWPKVAHGIQIDMTLDPEVVQINATVPYKVAYDFMSAFAAYQQTVIAGLNQIAG